MSKLTEYNPTEAALADLRNRFSNVVFDLTTTKGDKDARAARKELVTLRTTLEAKRKELKAPALERAKLIDTEAQRIKDAILELETPIDEQIKADEARREAEKAAKEQAERERIAAHQSALQQIGECALQAVGESSEQIRKWIEGLESTTMGPEWEEFQQMAVATKAKTLGTLNDLLAKAEAADAEAKRLAEERAELERQRAEQARLAAEAAEARRKAEEDAAAAAAEIRRQQEAEAAAARAKIEAEEREARERIERQEREAREAREKADAEARAQRAAEEERLRKEREALEAERRQREEREAAARRAEEERQRSEREVAEAKAREEAEAARKTREAEEAAALAKRREAERLQHGRDLLESFVAAYADDPEFAAIVPAIREFLGCEMERPMKEEA